RHSRMGHACCGGRGGAQAAGRGVRHGEEICNASLRERDAVTHTLSEMQSFFAGAIRRPVAVAEQPGVRALTPELIAGNSRLSPVAQLEVYREQFWMRHVDALAEDF